MKLVTPDIGLIFWTGLIFLLLLFILTKYVWKPILSAVEKREKNIQESLDSAKKMQKEMERLKSQNENLLKEARVERDEMIKSAKETSDRMISDARATAKIEAEKVISSAKTAFESEKQKAAEDLKNQVASIALEIAEKVLREDLSSKEKQKDLANKYAADIHLN